MIKNDIRKLIEKSLNSLKIEKKGDFSLEHPADISNGDYSTNVAMIYAKVLGQNPKELADKICQELKNNLGELSREINKVEIAGPGFINFYLSDSFFGKSLSSILKDGQGFGRSNLFDNKKILIEYTDPNPFKVFHIGHLMSNAIGESLSRIMAFSGGDIKRANYQGDVGLHVAKALWGILNLIADKPKDSASLREKVDFISKAYVLGSAKYEEDEKSKSEIIEINKKVFDHFSNDKELEVLYRWGRELSLEHFEEIYKKLGTKFDYYFFESEVSAPGEKAVREFLKKGVFEESDGAIVFKGDKYGLHTRVFINSQGLPTYESKEVGLIKKKFDTVNPDLSLTITANEQSDYFKVILKALSLIYPEIASKTSHISHGMMRFASGKMSSRKGNIITGESLLEDVYNLVIEKMKGRDFSPKIENDIANKVSVSAIKYSILKQKSGGDIVYDFDKSISFEGDSGPYLQYSSVRANAVLEKAKEQNIEAWNGKTQKVFDIEKRLYFFPEIIERSANTFEPHHIATYITELCSAFNKFYSENQIVSKDDELSPKKIAITKAFNHIVKTGLSLLAIEVPDKM